MSRIERIPHTVPNAGSDTPAYDARTLTGDGDLALILLDGQTYVLRITRAGKLILTK